MRKVDQVLQVDRGTGTLSTFGFSGKLCLEVIAMARGPRKRSRSGVYHVMLRGINRQAIFESDDDRIIFLSVIRQYVELGKYFLYGYCLMDNHIYLLMKEAEDDISTSVKRVSSRFVFWYNKKYERCGHLFQERFKSEAVRGDLK